MTRKTILLALLLAAPATGQTNLLENANFADTPNPQDYRGVEDHLNVWRVPLPAGFTGLSHWTVSGRGVWIGIWKSNHEHRLELEGSSQISQSIPTQAKHIYRVHFRWSIDPEGAPQGKIAITFGGQTRELSGKPGQSGVFDEIFPGEPSATTLTFASRMTGPGQNIRMLGLQVLDDQPTASPGSGATAEHYHEIDSWAASATSLDKAGDLLSESFAGTNHESEKWDRPAYISYWHGLLDRHLNVSTKVDKVEPTDTGATVTIDRHIWGVGINRVSRWKDVWVKDGEHWLLRSSDQI